MNFCIFFIFILFRSHTKSYKKREFIFRFNKPKCFCGRTGPCPNSSRLAKLSWPGDRQECFGSVQAAGFHQWCVTMQISACVFSSSTINRACPTTWERQFVIASPLREVVLGTKECTVDNIETFIDTFIGKKLQAHSLLPQHANLLDCEFLSSRNWVRFDPVPRREQTRS